MGCSPPYLLFLVSLLTLPRSIDGATWTAPTVVLQPGGPGTYSYDAVCDPSVVRYRGSYFLYHTCRNSRSAPDQYAGNRICVAVADSIAGPYVVVLGAAVQDLTCTPPVGVQSSFPSSLFDLW